MAATSRSGLQKEVTKYTKVREIWILFIDNLTKPSRACRRATNASKILEHGKNLLFHFDNFTSLT